MPDFLITFKLKFRNKIFVLIGLVIFGHLMVQAQTSEQYIKQGDKAYNEADYYTAFFYYNQAKDLDSSGIEAYYKLGEASRNINDYKNAFSYYERVLKTDKYKNFPLSEFWMGMMSKFLGNYDKSGACYARFIDRYSFQDYYKKKALQEIQSAAWLKEHNISDPNIDVERMGNEINTQFSEFAASELHDSFYQFSSIREQPSSIKKSNKEFLSKIYTMKLDNNEWKENKDLFGCLDSFDQHVANGTFSEDGKRFYFNVCENKNVSDLRCDIYVSSFTDDKWQSPIKLNEEINPLDATNTQPYEAENKVLYFVSDRKGGEGKLDIWYSLLDENGAYSHPVNLAGINSADNDISPFYDTKNKRLYFSSEWYYGYGGYDIFYANKKEDQMIFDEPENAGMPLNSSCNDVYYNINAKGTEAYLSSNRKGSLFLKGESCCNDIYKVKVNNRTKTVDTTTIALHNIKTVDTISLTNTSKTSVDSNARYVNTTIEKLKSMLPVTVYFHNDIPDPRSTSDSTILNYKTSYDAYTMMKGEYILEYRKVSDSIRSINEIASLFDKNIDEGYKKLLLFTDYLQNALSGGQSVTITLEGYCSPLALNDYNIHLANRRIASLKNYFYSFNNGIFRNYLASGKLIYKMAPFGEEKADQKISDNRLDTPRSVYDPKAALERRVAIIAIDAL